MSLARRLRTRPSESLPHALQGHRATAPGDRARRRAALLQVSWGAAFNPGLLGRLVRASGGSMSALADQPPAWLRTRIGGRRSGTPMPSPGVSHDHAVLTWLDDAYPAPLRHLEDAPPVVFARGDLETLTRIGIEPLVAIVGARAPSRYGLEMTAQIAAELVRSGVGVVSGLALGIDAAAHRAATGALPRQGDTASGGGPTPPVIGVLGCGVDVVHPRANARLFAEVSAAGLLLSEYWWDLPAQAWRFPARNRIIAALADAVVIVEGRAQSGARHTADFAAQLGIDVLAVPGEAGRRLSQLPNDLLRNGAGFCESAGDVLAVLDARGKSPGSQAKWGGGDGAAGRCDVPCPPAWWAAHSVESVLYEALADGERTVDELVGLCGRPPAAVLGCLSRLELDGIVVAAGGQRYRIVRRSAGPVHAAAEHTP